MIPRFLLDVHLGRLARNLRLLGFDSIWDSGLDDAALSLRSLRESRILLSCDRALILENHPGEGYLLKMGPVAAQLEALTRRYSLAGIARPFTRCLDCNGSIAAVSASEAFGAVEPAIVEYYDEFFRCSDCRKFFWKGSHYERMRRFVESIIATGGSSLRNAGS